MRRNTTGILLFFCLIVSASVAQEGFPLDGTWHGEWGSSGSERTPVVLVMNWDGTSIKGMINPGPDAVLFSEAYLDPSDWTVHIEASSKDELGEPISIIIEGQLDNIGSYNRTIEGTWYQGLVAGRFLLTRD